MERSMLKRLWKLLKATQPIVKTKENEEVKRIEEELIECYKIYHNPPCMGTIMIGAARMMGYHNPIRELWTEDGYKQADEDNKIIENNRLRIAELKIQYEAIIGKNIAKNFYKRYEW
jgi:hypothetical protein